VIERAEARGRSVIVATEVLVGAERHARDADEPFGPRGRSLLRHAELARAFAEELDVGDAVFCGGRVQAVEPRVALGVAGGSLRDDRHELVDGAVHGGADRPRRAVDVLERG
jgi:hypothetical protein